MGKIEQGASMALHSIRIAGDLINNKTITKEVRSSLKNVGTSAADFVMRRGAFWNSSAGKEINNTGIWLDENVNPLYWAFNGINSQFTHEDYLTSNPMSHGEGLAQALSIMPMGRAAEVVEMGFEAVENTVVNTVEKEAAKTGGEGFKSFSAFKRAYGSAGEGQAWHHIVE